MTDRQAQAPEPQTQHRTQDRTRPSGVGTLIPAAWLMGTGIVLVSLILRPGATSVGPVMAEIRNGAGMGTTAAAFLSALPGLSFAVSGALAARLGHRLGAGASLAVACAMAAVGLLARTLAPGAAAFLLASVVGLFGAGLGNVLLPMAIKQRFPLHSGIWTAVYVTVLPVGAVLPQLVAPALMAAGGTWQGTLAVWGWVSALAFVPWAVMGAVQIHARGRRRRARHGGSAPTPGPGPAGIASSRGTARSGEHGPARTEEPGTARAEELGAASDLDPSSGPSLPDRAGGISLAQVARSPRARAMALFFGLQSMQAYVAFGWLPQIFRDAGVPMSQASLLLAAFSVWGIPGGFIVPPLVARSRHLQWWVAFFAALLVVGYGGLLLAPTTLPWLWPCALGVSGFCFQVALVLVTSRTRDYRVTAALSGFTQSLGYVLACAGPFVVGWLHGMTGGWSVPLVALAVTAVPMGWAGWRASAPGYIDDELAPARA